MSAVAPAVHPRNNGQRRRAHRAADRQLRLLGVARSRLRDGEIGVDGFAGGGGFSLGFMWATGMPPAVAINHDEHAIAMHTVNHPESRHYRDDIFHVSPKEAAQGRPVGLAHFSPDCTDFSAAKGGKPLRKEIRGLAWVMLRWAVDVRPRILSLENVREFAEWGPLDPATDKRIAARKGETFRAFVACLSSGLAANHPAWQDMRDALIARPAVVDVDGETVLVPEKPGVTESEFDAMAIRLRAGLGYAVDWHVLNAADYGAPTSRKRLYLIARCDGDAVCWPERTHGPRRGLKGWQRGLKPYRTAAECIDFSIPCPSIFLSKDEGRAAGVKRPLRPATMRRIAEGIRRYVLENPKPFIVGCGGRMGQTAPASSADPLNTITGKNESNDLSLTTATLIQTGYGEREGQAPRALDIRKPLGTVVAGGQKHAVVTAAFMTQHNTGLVGHHMTEPVSTIVEKGCTQGVVEATLLQQSYGTPQWQETDTPLNTIVGGVNHNELVSAHLTKFHAGSVGAPVDEPMPTITGGSGSVRPAGCAHALGEVAVSLTKFNGTSADGQPVDEPICTVTSGGDKGGGHVGLQAVCLAKYYGCDQHGQACDEPLHTIPTLDRFALVAAFLEEYLPGTHFGEAVTVEIGGETYILADIGMRMLQPRELARAQGFPDDYILTGTKSQQVARIGNSVCPDVAAAIVRANLDHEEPQKAAA